MGSRTNELKQELRRKGIISTASRGKGERGLAEGEVNKHRTDQYSRKSAALPILPLREQAGASSVATSLCGAHGGWTIMRGGTQRFLSLRSSREGSANGSGTTLPRNAHARNAGQSGQVRIASAAGIEISMKANSDGSDVEKRWRLESISTSDPT